MKRNILRSLMWGCLGAVLFAPQAFSQEEPTTKAILESRYITESDVDAQSGQVAISETKFSFEHEFKLDNGMPVTVLMQNKHIDINSDVAVYLPSNLVSRSLGFGVKFPAPFTQSENYFVGVDVYPSMNTDGWDETSSSALRVPGRVYLVYRRDENFMVIGGMLIRPGYDQNFFPIVGFVYRPNDQWYFNFASDNPHITYQFSEKTKIIVEADLVNEEYEVTRNGEKGRVLFYREVSTGVGLAHDFTKSITGLVTVGSVFSRTLKYEDDIGKVQPDAGLYVKARVNINF